MASHSQEPAGGMNSKTAPPLCLLPGRRSRFLHLFSGPAGRPDGLRAMLAGMDCECEEYDIINGDRYDLADDAVYNQLKAEVEGGGFDGGVLGPPCHTFSNARREDDGGPRPLRAPGPKLIYGRVDLRPEEKEDVRLGTLLALRALEVFMLLRAQGRPVLLEQPRWRQDTGKVSMFLLPEFRRVLAMDGVKMVHIVQCAYGAPSEKPTTLLHANMDFEDACVSCKHAKTWWRLPSTGAWLQAPHPPLKGKELFIPASEWKPQMLLDGGSWRRKFGRAPYLTKDAAAYPGGLNRYFANKLVAACSRHPPADKPMRLVGRWRNTLVREEALAVGLDDAPGPEPHTIVEQKLTWRTPLRGSPEPTDSEKAEQASLGGMRHPRRASKRIEGYNAAGHSIFAEVLSYIGERPHVLQACMSAIGSEDPNAGPDKQAVAEVRGIMDRVLGLRREEGSRCELTSIDVQLLTRWAEMAGDPDGDTIREWLAHGSPAGIERDIPDCGIFPASDSAEPDLDVGDLLFRDPEGHVNYTSVEGVPEAQPEVQRLIDTGFVKVFDNLRDCENWLGGKPLTSKLAMVTKTRADGSVKRRLILDCRESKANQLAAKGGRILLPRPTDVIDDALFLLHCHPAEPEVGLEALVLDFRDWFYAVPLHRDDMKYFVTAYRETPAGGLKYIVFLTQTQGSKNAPLVCGRVAALVGRLSQSLFNEHDARLQIYVDDPCFLVSGSGCQRDLRMAVLICVWSALGLPLAFKKASRGINFGWIGFQYTIRAGKDGQVRVTGKPELMQEIRSMTMEHTRINVLGVRDLQKYVGKANYVAGVVDTWRPFITDLWAVIHSSADSRAPPNCVWTKQWRHVTDWFLAFFRGESGSLVRDFKVSSYFQKSVRVRIVTDASPWGIGGFLILGNEPVYYFASPLDQRDSSLAEAELGSPRGQQVWEALAILVALRVWRKYWSRTAVELYVSSDSVAALTLLLKLRAKPRAVGLGIVAREIALDFSRSSYRPSWYEHIPGVANTVADILSRRYQPDKQFALPGLLRHAREVTAPIRDDSFFLVSRPLRKAD
eukprot:s2027_g8.t2